VYRRVTVEGYRIAYRPEWIGWVDELAALSVPVWATMWMRGAVEYFSPRTGIGTTIRRFIDFDAYRDGAGAVPSRTGFGVGNYKHPGIEAVAGDSPLVWIDDDLEPWQFDWARQRSAGGAPTLLLQPDPAVGLTFGDFSAARDFLVENGQFSQSPMVSPVSENPKR
jgi:hypothetical protein